MWGIISWKEFQNRKMKDVAEIISFEDINVSLDEMKKFNAKKGLTTSDYRVFNLDSILDDKNLRIEEK